MATTGYLLRGVDFPATLNNNRVLVSSSGNIAENAALLSGNVVFANASGLPDGTTDFKWTALTTTLTVNGSIQAGGSTASGVKSYAFGNGLTVSGDRSCGIYLGTSSTTISTAGVFCVLGGNMGVGTVSPLNTLDIVGNMGWGSVLVNTNITILSTDQIILYRIDTNAARTINLPTAASTLRRVYFFKDELGTGAGTNNVTINAAGGDNIDGGASYVMSVNRQAVGLYSNGGLGWGVF